MSDVPSVPPPKMVKTTNRGGGRPPGSQNAVLRPQDVIVDTAVEIMVGKDAEAVAAKHNLTKTEVRSIQTVTGMAPAAFFEHVANKMEPVLEETMAALHEKIQAVRAGTDVASVKELVVGVGVLTQNLLNLRGQTKPTTLNQTNIQINGLSRSDALAYLKDGVTPPQKP